MIFHRIEEEGEIFNLFKKNVKKEKGQQVLDQFNEVNEAKSKRKKAMEKEPAMT